MKFPEFKNIFSLNENNEIIDFNEKYIHVVHNYPIEYNILHYYFNFIENVSNKKIDFLIKNVDLNFKNDDGNNFLMLFFYEDFIKLNKNQINYVLENTNLKNLNNENTSALLHCLKSNKKKLNKKQFLYLIENSDLNLNTKKDESIFIEIITNNDFFKLNEKEIGNIIKKIDFSKLKNPMYDFIDLLTFNHKLNMEQLNYIYEKSCIEGAQLEYYSYLGKMLYDKFLKERDLYLIQKEKIFLNKSINNKFDNNKKTYKI